MPSTAPVARESFQFQVQEDQVANVLVVFDDKDSRPGGVHWWAYQRRAYFECSGPTVAAGLPRPLS